ncbi:hypothetical protein GQ600_7076 [Phytophthora cactorum]|nr:hypothetical protein GQ600_7076 [Phytophthora cactorum]
MKLLLDLRVIIVDLSVVIPFRAYHHSSFLDSLALTAPTYRVFNLAWRNYHSRVRNLGAKKSILMKFHLTRARATRSAIALVVTYIIIDPNLEIDERLCPRISVSDQVEDSNRPNELLWKLQQHLAAVDMDQRYFEALMVE